ncbi:MULTISPECIES: hypothetical protein [Burkholderia cepacia complex]|uniref:hypothetical protein n=1 Tax=Burkholderia cepacia complex TaxID=87882 RepID=UPI001CF2E049|nr:MULTISPECIES: hypothetical protein [Burkholderia cepacia complex]MCA7981265.1 hypothetical protein [Burkholderia cepacia]
MSANTPNPPSHTNDAGVPPAPPEAHQKAGFAQRSNRLRLIAAHWLGCTADASICVLHRWTRPDDDARAVRLETNVDGCVRRITLFRLSSGAWSPVWQ